MTNINFEVEDKLHTIFKISCIKRRVDMKDRLVKLIKMDIKKDMKIVENNDKKK